MAENNFNVVCPKCNVNIPNDSVFCPNCGCNIEDTKKQIELENAKEEAEARIAENKNIPAQKKNSSKTSRALAIISVLLLCICLAEGIFLHNSISESKKQVEEYEKIIKENENRIDTLEAIYKKAKRDEDVLELIQLKDNWGYATENFHANTGIVVLNGIFDSEKVKIISNYSGNWVDSDFNFETATLFEKMRAEHTTGFPKNNYYGATYYLKNSDKNIVDVYWDEAKWINEGIVQIIPVNPGSAVLTITNSEYDNEINILVIVTE